MIDDLERARRLDGPVHGWFELTYAQYLTIPRSLLQEMPIEWQERFTTCLRQLDEAFDWRPEEGRYWVELRDGRGRMKHDLLKDYRHPDFAHIDAIRTGRAE